MVQDTGDSSSSPSPLEAGVGEIYFVELVKEDGTLGFSVTVRFARRAWGEVGTCAFRSFGCWTFCSDNVPIGYKGSRSRGESEKSVAGPVCRS